MSTYSTSETAIWERVIHPTRGDLPLDAAQFFLNLAFDQHDLDRMHELALKNQEGALPWTRPRRCELSADRTSD